MSDEGTLNELLSLWQREAEQGRDTPVALLCRDHPELVDEAERRIGALRQMHAIQLADQATVSTACHVQTDPPAATGLPRPIPTIPGYEILSKLGEGGMGIVYKARHLRLNRIVALKVVLAGGHASEEHLARFRTEAESVARLHHPGVVQVYEYGDHDGLPYLALEYCEGGSLAAKLRGTPLPPKQTAALVEQVARAIDAAHRQQIIHRDLTPGNVLLTEDGTPKVTDFGLAKKLDEVGRTASGAVMGTPSYMAPEQAGGKSKAVGPAADVYALGAILYECLTGGPPFRAASQVEILLQVVKQEPVPPRRLNPRLPRDLETICLKCLQKAPEKRYATVKDLAEDLRRFQAGEPIKARPVGNGERLYRWAKRHPTAAALIPVSGVASLAVVGLLVGLVFQNHLQIAYESEAVARQAEQEQREKAQEAYRHLEDAHRKEAELKRQLAWTAYLHGIGLAYRNWQESEVGLARSALAHTPLDHRHWEWNYLQRLCDGNLGNFAGHQGPIWSMACSPDGKNAASASADGTVKVWEISTGRLLRSMKADTGSVWAVAYSPDGKRLASGGLEGVVRLWDPETGHQLFSLSGHAGAVVCLAFSPDGQQLASAGGMVTRNGVGNTNSNLKVNEVRVWDMYSREVRATLRGHDESVWTLAFSSNGQYLASGDFRGTIRVWDSVKCKQITELTEHRGAITGLVFDPAGRSLFSSSEDQTVKSWAFMNGRSDVTYKHPAMVHSVALSTDGRFLACGLKDQTIRVWDVATKQELTTLRGHSGPVFGLAFVGGSASLISGGNDRYVRVWNATANQQFQLMRGHTNWVERARFMPDNRQVVSAGRDGTLRMWDVTTGQLVNAIQFPRSAASCVAVSPDGRLLASGGYDSKVHIWELPLGRLVRSLDGHTAQVREITFSPDGRIVASAGFDFRVKLWDVKTGQELRTLAGQWCLAFSPDGKRLATGSGYTAKVWDIVTGQDLLTLSGHMNDVSAIAFSPDGRRVISGSLDQTARLWDADTGQQLVYYQGSEGIVDVTFSPDGRRLALAHGPHLKLLKADTLEEVLSLKPTENNLHTVAYSSNGRLIATGGWDSNVQIWDGSPSKQ